MNPVQPTLQSLGQALQSAWGQRSAREQQLLSAGAAVLVLAALWLVALAPALRTWQQAPARQAALDSQTRQMQQLQALAQTLKKPSAITRAEALRWLETHIPTGLGPQAQWRLQGDRLSVTLSGTTPAQLATWLAQAREQAQALPIQAQLQQMPPPAQAAGASTGTGAINPVLWSGSVLLSLP
jgi:general secretion pathway protein M